MKDLIVRNKDAQYLHMWITGNEFIIPVTNKEQNIWLKNNKLIGNPQSNTFDKVFNFYKSKIIQSYIETISAIDCFFYRYFKNLPKLAFSWESSFSRESDILK